MVVWASWNVQVMPNYISNFYILFSENILYGKQLIILMKSAAWLDPVGSNIAHDDKNVFVKTLYSTLKRFLMKKGKQKDKVNIVITYM